MEQIRKIGVNFFPAKVSKTSNGTHNVNKRFGRIRLCPFCKKPTLGPADNISGWMTPDVFSCSNCGYRGQLCIEVDPDEYERYQKESSSDENEVE